VNGVRHEVGDVAIVGAGVIGLSIAFELASDGATVRVYDSGEPARGASWAGAGMLAPFTEAIENFALQELCETSLAAYPAFAQRVAAASGIDPHLRLNGILCGAFDRASLDALERRVERLRQAKHGVQLLDHRRTIECEPVLGKGVLGAAFMEEEGHVDNRRLGRALWAACESLGVSVHSGVGGLRVKHDGRKALGVANEAGFFAAGVVINAAGAWSGRLEGLPAECIVPVFPIKGQMLALAIPSALVRHATWLPGAYLVPRDDGRLLVGATVEDCGFDERVTAAGIRQLLDAVLTAAPALENFAVTETWAGLRPGTPDGKPFIGSTPLERYFVATGHFRNGILLAPATAALIHGAIEGRSVEVLRHFSVARHLPEDAKAESKSAV